MKLDDPEIVRNEYATEAGLRARWSAYEQLTGLTAPEIAFRAVEEIMPARMLEVGCGWGELSARVAAELGVEVDRPSTSRRGWSSSRASVGSTRGSRTSRSSRSRTATSGASRPTGCSTTCPISTAAWPSSRACSRRVDAWWRRRMGCSTSGELWSLVGRDRARNLCGSSPRRPSRF